MNRGTRITFCLGMKGLSKGRMQLSYSSALTSRGYGHSESTKAQRVYRGVRKSSCERVNQACNGEHHYHLIDHDFSAISDQGSSFRICSWPSKHIYSNSNTNTNTNCNTATIVTHIGCVSLLNTSWVERSYNMLKDYDVGQTLLCHRPFLLRRMQSSCNTCMFDLAMHNIPVRPTTASGHTFAFSERYSNIASMAKVRRPQLHHLRSIYTPSYSLQVEILRSRLHPACYVLD